jgi:hypothetical protein
MLKVCPALRPLNAVESSPTRATAPPIWKMGNVVREERIRIARSTVMSMMSSFSSATSHARM